MAKRRTLAPLSRTRFHYRRIDRRECFGFQLADGRSQNHAGIPILAAAVSVMGRDALWRGWSEYDPLDCRARFDLRLAGLVEEQREKSKILSESEARFRSMANSAPALIWMSGLDGRFNFFNKAWLDLTGRTLRQELGNGWAEGLHPEDFHRFFEKYDSSFSAREEFSMEHRLRKYDGEYSWIFNKGVPRFASDGTFVGYIGSAIDITQRKEAETNLQQEREQLARVTRVSTMGELAASLAHELNQPLTAILANAQAAERLMAAKPPDLEEVGAILKDIIEDNNRAGEIIWRMRALIRKENIELVSLDLPTVIRDIVTLLHSEAILHNVRIRLDLGHGFSPVCGDRVHLQQVVLNLLLTRLTR